MGFLFILWQWQCSTQRLWRSLWVYLNVATHGWHSQNMQKTPRSLNCDDKARQRAQVGTKFVNVKHIVWLFVQIQRSHHQIQCSRARLWPFDGDGNWLEQPTVFILATWRKMFWKICLHNPRAVFVITCFIDGNLMDETNSLWGEVQLAFSIC